MGAQKIQDLIGKTDNRLENIEGEIKELDDAITIVTPEVRENTKRLNEFDKGIKSNIESIDQLKANNTNTANQITNILQANININEQLQSLNENSGTKEDLNNIIKTNEQAIGELKKGFDENINNIMTANITINENFNGLQIKSEETRKALEDIKNNHKEDINILTQNIDSEKERIDNIEEEVKELDDSIKQVATNVDKNTNCLHELENAKLLHRDAIDETKHLILEIDTKLKGIDAANSDRIKKAEENIQTNTDQLGLLDGSTKYITEQITNIFQTNIATDEKINQIEELRQKSDTKIKAEFDNLNQELNEFEEKNAQKIQDLIGKTDNRLENIEGEIKELDDAITTVTPEVRENTKRLNEFDKGIKSNIESIDQLKANSTNTANQITNILQANININEQLQSLNENSGTKEDLNNIIKTNEQAIGELKKGFD